MNRLDLKRKFGNFFGRLTTNNERTVILLYHSIGDTPFAVSENLFRQQMNWLAERFSIVPLDVAMRNCKKKIAQAVITFDDGYTSVHDRAAPIMAEYGATGTVYLNTRWVEDFPRKASDASLGHYPNEFFMNWQEAEALANAGWTIGSHGVDHLDLTKLDPASVNRELIYSKLEIEKRIGRSCDHFAYTWGRFSSTLQHAVRNAGYMSAVSGLHGPLTATSDRYALPRIDIRAEYEQRDFVDIVEGHWDYLALKQRLARRLA